MKNLSETNGCLYEFANFQLLPAERLLLLEENPVSLPPKVFDTLQVLVERGGHLVEKDELLDKIWADAFVEEATLARNISILRKALGASDSQKFIETVPKRGYRFTEPIRRRSVTEESAPVSADEKSLSETSKTITSPKTRRPILWLMLAFIVTGGIFASLSFWSARPASSDAVKSIAVLPFKTIDSAERDESLELGMANAVITRLGNIRQIVVRPTNTISKYLGSESDSAQAGKDLQVEAVLEGTVQRRDDRVRVTARLLKTQNGTQLWAETFDVRLTDIFTVQDSISLQIAQSLNLKLKGGEEISLSRRETENPEAYEFCLKGQYFLEKRSLQKAIDYFTQAIVLDPNIAAAYTGLADAFALQVSYTLKSPQENLPKARTAVEKALMFDENAADAHATLGHIQWLDWDWKGAEKSLLRALELNPNSPLAHSRYSAYLSSMARHEEALIEARRAHELDPTSVSTNQTVERAYYFARRYNEALEASRKTLELNPGALGINSWREMALEQKGMFDEAFELRLRGMSAIGIEADQTENLRKIYRERGRQAFWQNQIEEMKRKASQRYVLPYSFARNYARLGDVEQALAWLERCERERSDHLTLVKVDPIFDNLRDNPRFGALLDRIGLG